MPDPMTLDEVIAALQAIRESIAGRCEVKVQSSDHAVRDIRMVDFNATWPAVMIKTRRKRGQAT